MRRLDDVGWRQRQSMPRKKEEGRGNERRKRKAEYHLGLRIVTRIFRFGVSFYIFFSIHSYVVQMTSPLLSTFTAVIASRRCYCIEMELWRVAIDCLMSIVSLFSVIISLELKMIHWKEGEKGEFWVRVLVSRYRFFLDSPWTWYLTGTGSTKSFKRRFSNWI